ncbi:MAG: tyrosine-type recombinase/integrase [Chloroflexi bacterium]|nr:tyrosine-type recombinase/integrase [Chloroflexota bacterium]
MKQAKTLRPEEIKRVLAHVATRRHAVRDRAVVLTSFLSGMRAHEIASLRIVDVLDEFTNVRDEIVLRPEQTKGSRTRRVFVNAKLKKELATYINAECAGIPISEALFRSQKRHAFNGNTMCQLFLGIYKSCGIKGASSHSGRRTFITNLASKSISVRVLAALAGHSSISTTQRYIDVNDLMLRNAVELA